MKAPIRALMTLIISICPWFIQSQSVQEQFGEYMQTYYLDQPADLIEMSITTINDSNTEYERFEPILTGFFGALFSHNSTIRSEFMAKIEHIDRSDFRSLMENISNSNIDSIYANTPLSPSYNDMNWSSFFATGNAKYIDKIIANMPLSEERIDRNLFLTGASAKWSLSSNASQYADVEKHLLKHKKSNALIREILEKEPYQLRQEMIDVIRAQRAVGLWTEP